MAPLVNEMLDAHVHLWNRATDPQEWIDPETMAAIDRDFGADDLAAMLEETGMTGAVVVQSSNSLGETRRLLELAATTDRIRGVVGWLDLTSDVDEQLASIPLAVRKNLVGVRHLVHIDPDELWLDRDDVNAGLAALGRAGLAFDLVVRWWQLPLAAQTAARHPGVRFVLDHLGGVPDEAQHAAAWQSGLRALAAQPNTVAKLSGVSALTDLPGVVDVAFDVFGADRLLFGSDWPMVRLAAGAVGWRRLVDALLTKQAPDARQHLFAGTAVRVYGLDAPEVTA